MQAVSLLTAPPTALPMRSAPVARPADSAGAATARPTAATGQDYIDVEVLWEEADPSHDPAWGRVPGPAAAVTPLRITTPSAAIAAYRNASSTALLPHTRIDVFA